MKLIMENWREFLKEDNEGTLVARVFSLAKPPQEGMDASTWAERVDITLPNGEKKSILEIFDELNEQPGGEWEGWKNNITEPLETLEFMQESIRGSINDWADMKGLDTRFEEI